VFLCILRVLNQRQFVGFVLILLYFVCYVFIVSMSVTKASESEMTHYVQVGR